MIKFIRLTNLDGVRYWLSANAIAAITSTQNAWDDPPPNANTLIELLNDSSHYVLETAEQVVQLIDALSGENTLDGGNF